MGMASCTDFGTSKCSLSCFSAACRVLIKFQSLLDRGIFQGFGVQILRFEHQLSGIEQFRPDHGQEKPLKGHAVVGEKAAEGKRERGQDAHPADLSRPYDVLQPKIHPHRHKNGQQREQELAQGQAEKQALLIVPDFFVDAYFYEISRPFNMG